MPAARYWRVVGLQSIAGGPLELSALHLYLAGSRVDAAATLTCTVPPSAGAVANLQDNDTATVCRWLDVSAPGFALVWDFGAGNVQDVTAVRLGSGGLKSEFVRAVLLQSSSDGVNWGSLLFGGGDWAGANALSFVVLHDHYYSSVSLLLHCDGAEGSTTFTDSSPATKLIPAYGTARISAAQGRFGGASLLLGGSGDYLSAPANTDYVFGAGDFTVELWIKTTTTAEKVLVDQYAAGNTWQLAVRGGRLSWYCAVAYLLQGSIPVNDNTWHHVAATRAGGILRFFVDGVLDGFASDTLAYVTLVTMGIGAQVHSRNAAYDFPGHMDDLRITKGVARYTANFTPPTEPFQDSSASIPLRPRISPTVTTLSGGMAGTTGTVLVTPSLQHDLQDAGPYRVHGTVHLDATPTDLPLRRRVQLYNQRDGRLIREAWSDATTGAYSFDGIRGGDGTRYFVAAFDHTQDRRAVVADGIIPEAPA